MKQRGWHQAKSLLLLIAQLILLTTRHDCHLKVGISVQGGVSLRSVVCFLLHSSKEAEGGESPSELIIKGE